MPIGETVWYSCPIAGQGTDMRRDRSRRMALTAGLALLAAAVLTCDPAMAKQARCVITEAGGGGYAGPCLFAVRDGGSFVVSPPDDEADLAGRVAISVDIIAPGIAEVRGATVDGVNGRWGEARRSAEDPACWVGDDFSVCVY